MALSGFYGSLQVPVEAFVQGCDVLTNLSLELVDVGMDQASEGQTYSHYQGLGEVLLNNPVR